jgi:hypothetical protein
MPILIQTDRIEARQREIAKEIERLQGEARNLEIALEVAKQFGVDSPSEVQAEVPDHVVIDAEARKLGPPRPSGCPTNFEMVDMILASAEREGKDGLTISEIISEIRTRYWPGLNDVQVSAPIYAFVRQDRLKKTPGGKFKRIKKSDITKELAVMTPERIES